MSLEQAIADLTTAIKENSALIVESNAGRKEAIAAAEALAEKKAKATEPKKPGRPPKAKEATADDLFKGFEAYLKVDDENERKTRKEFVVAILNELGVDAVTEKPGKKGIAPEDRQKALDWLADKIAGKEVNFGKDEAPAEDNSLL